MGAGLVHDMKLPHKLFDNNYRSVVDSVSRTFFEYSKFQEFTLTYRV